MNNVESMDYTHSHPSTIASLSSAALLSPVPYTFLKIATIPTYYGISIAIPRYIAMQLSTVPFMTHLSLSYCISRYPAGCIHIGSYFVPSIEL